MGDHDGISLHGSHVPVCVVGAGPSGCIAAIKLARAGHEVVLAQRPSATRHLRCEVLSPSAVEQLRYLGLENAIDRAHLGDVRAKTVLWAQRAPIRLDAQGVLLDRAAFDECLRRSARSAGVKFLRLAGLVNATRMPDRGWLLCDRNRVEVNLTTDLLVDATGLGRPLAGQSKRIGEPLASISAQVPETALPPDEMFVEAFEHCWLWLASTPQRRVFICVFCGPGHLNGVEPGVFLRTQIARSKLINASTQGPVFTDVYARNATGYAHCDCADETYLAVGDASLSRDPLLSHGLQWAISSAISGATAANTILTVPDKTALAVDFHRRRQQEAQVGAERACTLFYGEGQAIWGSPFWSARATSSMSPEGMVPDTPVYVPRGSRVAFSRDASLAPEPVLHGDTIEGVNALFHPNLERPVAYVCDIPVEKLLEAASAPMQFDDLEHAISAQIGTQNAAAFLHHLLANGVLKVMA